MICPIRCFTCGHVLADKIRYFQKRKTEIMGSKKEQPMVDVDNADFLNLKELLDELELSLMCCRRHMLSHVDLIDII